MREIKFRAWVKTDIEDDGIYEYMESDASTFVEPFELHNSGKIILLQYTGLKDKNGVEIYEGDVVEIKLVDGSEKFKVYYAVDEARFTVVDCNGDGWGLTYSNDIRVVGNIHENPELINQ